MKYNKLLAVHAGISPLIRSINHLRVMYRFGELPSEGILSDIVWSDPEGQVDGFEESPRGAGYFFGKSVSDSFCESNQIDCVLRSHQLCGKGYLCLFDNKIITVWSAPNYCKRNINKGSVLEIDELFTFRFVLYDEAKEKNKKIEDNCLIR